MQSPSSRSTSSLDSLFEENTSLTSFSSPNPFEAPQIPASREAPSMIEGLYFFPGLIPKTLADRVLSSVAECGYFATPSDSTEQEQGGKFEQNGEQTEDTMELEGPNQAMLFGRSKTKRADDPGEGREVAKGGESHTGLPRWADELVSELASLLKGKLDDEAFSLLFPEHSVSETKLDSESSHSPGSSTSLSKAIKDSPNPSKRLKVSHQAEETISKGADEVESRAEETKETSSTSTSTSTIQPCESRQLILNLYRSSEQGLSSHIDLPHRFGDGICLCSFGSGTVMEFEREAETELEVTETEENHREPSKDQQRKAALYLSPLSVLVLKGQARYEWRHGIPARTKDWVLDQGEKVDDLEQRREAEATNLGEQQTESEWKSKASLLERRGIRLSITIRWLLPGADVVGE